MSKGYTINYFVNTIKGAKAAALKSDVYEAISPRNGFFSVKAIALDNFLGGETLAYQIAEGIGSFEGLGKTPRSRLLKALSLRKKNGKTHTFTSQF